VAANPYSNCCLPTEHLAPPNQAKPRDRRLSLMSTPRSRCCHQKEVWGRRPGCTMPNAMAGGPPPLGEWGLPPLCSRPATMTEGERRLRAGDTRA
jgi:hypothetical protein